MVVLSGGGDADFGGDDDGDDEVQVVMSLGCCDIFVAVPDEISAHLSTLKDLSEESSTSSFPICIHVLSKAPHTLSEAKILEAWLIWSFGSGCVGISLHSAGKNLVASLVLPPPLYILVHCHLTHTPRRTVLEAWLTWCFASVRVEVSLHSTGKKLFGRVLLPPPLPSAVQRRLTHT